jgi:putative drug exporter of the RND superfamily
LFKRISELVIAHPWRVIATWVVLGAVVVAVAPDLSAYTSNNNSSFLPSSYQSVKALEAAEKYFPPLAQASGLIVVSATDGNTLSSSDESRIGGLVKSLSSDHIPAVSSVTSSPAYLSENKKVQLVQVVFEGQAGTSGPNEAVPKVREETDSFLAGSGLRGQLTGNAAISVDSTNAYENAEIVIGIATVLLILALLGAVFRSPLIAVLPIVIIGAVHELAQSLTALLADWFHFQVGPELAPLLLVVMFGVGTDYIVFLLFRYREHVAKGEAAVRALDTSVSRVGVVIASAAATVIAAFAALLIASLESLRTLAPGLIVGVALMLLAALTLAPAIMRLVGLRLFWPNQPKPPVHDHRTRSERIGEMVAKRPVLVLSVCGAVLVGLALGTLGYKTTYNQLAELPSSTLSQQAYDKMASAFPPGFLGPTQVFVVSSQKLDHEQVNELAGKLSKTKGVASVLPIQYDETGKAAVFQAILTDDPYSITAIDNVRGPVRETANGSIPGATVLVGGTTSQLVDVQTALRKDMKHVFPLALAIVAVILALLLQAVLAPFYLLVGVVLTYAATLGTIVFVFLDGAGFAGLDFTIPIIVYLFVMAIGTDYNILISSRLREEFKAGLPPREAARLAIVHGAPAVSAAGLILAGTFASLLLTGIQLLEEIGLAVALGVLLAANVLATRIVPTLAAIRGWHFWWPNEVHGKTAASKKELLNGPAAGETAQAGDATKEPADRR